MELNLIWANTNSNDNSMNTVLEDVETFRKFRKMGSASMNYGTHSSAHAVAEHVALFLTSIVTP